MSPQNAHGLSSIAIKVWLEIKSIISSNITLNKNTYFEQNKIECITQIQITK